MNYNNKSNGQNRWRTFSLVLLCLLVVISIIYMKRSSGEQKQLIPIGATDSSHMQVAVPDTPIDPDTLPPVSDTVQPSQLPDTILGKDKRDPYEAGYDDGYAAGCDDGAAHTEKANYDETNNFATATEKQNYVRGYREGYSQGYEDGRNGKQFNI